MVTNMDWEGERLIHSSDNFGKNAAWWWFMILAPTLNAMMKKPAMEDSWISKRMKAVRFSFINFS